MKYEWCTALCAALAAGGAFGGMLFDGERERFDKTIVYDKPDAAPIYWGGTSRSVEAYATDYCVFLDIIYEDGSATWQKWAKWTGGTHDWEKTANIFFPKKPVKKIILAAFLRNGKGKISIKDVFVNRELPPDGTVLAVQRRTNLPFDDSDDVEERYLSGDQVRYRIRRETPSTYRPKNTLPPDAVALWPADSMRIVTPLDFPDAGRMADFVSMELARGERESVQMCLTTGAEASFENVTLDISGLKALDGTPFKGRVFWERVGYLPLPFDYHHHPESHHGRMKWVPDPLLPAAQMKLRKGGTQAVLVTFEAARDARPGLYRGRVVAKSGRRELPAGGVDLTVRVRDFELPRTFGLKTGFAMMDGFIRKLYPDRFREMKRAAWDLMLDHRLNPDDITRTSPPEIEDLLHARDRGMNYFTVQNIVRPLPDQPWTPLSSPKELFTDSFYGWFTNSLAGYVAELRKHDLAKFAAIYGFDEREKEYYKGISEMYPKLKRDLGLPFITSAMLYRDMTRGTIASNSVEGLSADIYVPGTQVFRKGLTDYLHSQGKQVWWYVCCGPTHPHANFSSYEYPPLEARVLAWQTYSHGADGFLFWAVNFWSQQKAPLDETDTYFPDFSTYSQYDMPGDGVMTFPGKDHILPGLRLASVRDAVEDYEWLQLAGQRDAAATAETIARVTTGMTKWDPSPSTLRAARSLLAEIIERK